MTCGGAVGQVWPVTVLGWGAIQSATPMGTLEGVMLLVVFMIWAEVMGVTWTLLPRVTEPRSNAKGSPTCLSTVPFQPRDLKMQTLGKDKGVRTEELPGRIN